MSTPYERYQARKEKMLGTGKLTKSGIKELERPLNLAIEGGWDFVRNKLYGMDSQAALEVLYSSNPSVKTLEKKPAYLKKLLKKFPDESDLIQRLEQETVDLVEKFKPDIEEMNSMYKEAEKQRMEREQKREEQQKADANPVEYAPAPARSTVRMVNDVILKNTEALQAEIKEDIINRMQRCVDRFVQASQEGPITNLSKTFYRGSIEAEYLSTLTKRDSICASPRDPLVLCDDYQVKIEERAGREAEFIVDQFRMKTVKKLATVCDGFGKLNQVNMKVGSFRGAVEGNIGVEFDDGTAFDVRSQLVLAVSSGGKLFSRYPTTFHNVKRPGEPMVKKMPEVELAKLGAKGEIQEMSV